MTRTTQRSHPLDPLSAAEMRVAIATVRAAGKSPEVRLPTKIILEILFANELEN